MTAELTELTELTEVPAARLASPPTAPVAPRGMISPARRACEIGARVLIAVVVWTLLEKVFWGDVLHFATVTAPVSLEHLPYRDYLWEFPPLSVLPAILAHLGGSAYPGVFTAIMVALEYASLEILRRAFPDQRGAVARWWHLTVLPLAAFTWFRLDFLAVLFTAAGVVALVRRRPAGWWVVLGFAAKLWPAVLVVGLSVQRRMREVAVAVAGCLGVVALWWFWAPAGMGTFLAYRRGGGLQVESTLGAVRMLLGAHPKVVSGAWVVGDGGWGWVDPAGALLVCAATVAVLVWGRRRTLDPVRVCGALTVLLLLSSRILSPQYLVWVAPFAVLVAARGDSLTGLAFAASAWLTLVVLLDYDTLLLGGTKIGLVLVARNLVLVLLGLALLRGAVQGAVPPDRPGASA